MNHCEIVLKWFMLPSMTMRFLAFCLVVFLYAPTPLWAFEGQVQVVLDGDTFVVNGRTIRLLGINTPEKARNTTPAEPGARAATAALQKLVQTPGGKFKTVKLVLDTNEKDRYGRTLAHAYLPNGTWINKALLDQGVAHVYSFPDNRTHLKALLKAEQKARQTKTGTWQHKNWQVLDANTLTPDERIGQFRLVRGIPRQAVKTKKRIYLNFGTNWRTDFTVEIPLKSLPLFKADHIDPLTAYTQKKLLVRGRLKPVNGVMVTATHPEQIQVLD